MLSTSLGRKNGVIPTPFSGSTTSVRFSTSTRHFWSPQQLSKTGLNENHAHCKWQLLHEWRLRPRTRTGEDRGWLSGIGGSNRLRRFLDRSVGRSSHHAAIRVRTTSPSPAP